MMKTVFTSILTAMIVSLGLFYGLKPQGDGMEKLPVKETAYERIMRTNTLRCGYAVATPWFMADPKTNEFSGVGYDFTKRVANKAGLDIEWVEETGWGIAEQGIVHGRYDMLCGSVCVDPVRTRAAWYSVPFVHIPAYAVVRAQEQVLTTASEINRQGIRLGVKDGHVFEFIAKELFPVADRIYANNISDDTEFLLMLTSGKIDVAFAGQKTIDLYLEQHPGSIKPAGEPVRFCNGGFMLPKGDKNLKHLIDSAIHELNADGQIGRVVEKYMPLDPRYVRLPATQFRD